MKHLAIAISTALLVVAAGSTIAGPESKPSAAAPESRYQAQTARGQAAGEIVRKWAGYVQRVYGTSPAKWAAAMRTTFAEADVRNMARAAKMQTYEAMMGTLVGQRITDDQVITAMAKSGGSLDTTKSLGSPANDLVYTMVAPCRILDTRTSVGRLSSSVARDFFVHGASFASQGGTAGNCGIPADPSAVAINVVAVTPDADGFLTVYPSGTARPVAASLNYARNSITSNGVIAKTTLGSANDLTMFSQAGADVVIDIVGYFMAPVATALECQQAVTTVPSVANGVRSFETVVCPAGYTVTGGGVATGSNAGSYVNASGPSAGGAGSTTSWFSSVTNGTGSAQSYTHYATCCRVPGR
ncbi:MAG: hypothetical protein EOP02_00450 [Proteobacteria bacterium]|nr:MAG: hypothetical protein EOP02_00450 [Pseudomonadota bacterium]